MPSSSATPPLPPPPLTKSTMLKDPLFWVSLAFPFVLGLTVLLVVLLTKDQSDQSDPVFTCTANTDCSHSGTCTDGACVCDNNWTGDQCQILKTPPLLMTMGNDTCSRQPQSCANDNDCALKCTPVIPPGPTIQSQYTNTNRTIYTCQQMSKDDNAAGLEGSFCLPPKPESECARANLPHAIAGTLTWKGWAGVDAQGWSCGSEFPSFYPQNQETGACDLSSQVCRKGKWRFPCDGDKCDVDLTPEQQSKLMHTTPLFNGRCVCDDTDCTSDLQCVTKCVAGKCAAQRTGLDPLTGLPTCVADTCWNNPEKPAGTWMASKAAPYTDGYCKCFQGATITDQGCQWPNEAMIRPAAFLCPNNCSGNGKCVAAGKCECKSGYMGASCEQYQCVSGCFNQGECIGPNTCTCRSGYVYSPDTHECQPPIVCPDTPTVGAAPPRGKEKQTEAIQNADSFRNSSKTDCVRGSAAELRAVCVAHGWDDANPLTVQCLRYPDCYTIPCDDVHLCSDENTKKLVPMTKQAAGDGCRNPSLAELNEECDNLAKAGPDADPTKKTYFTSGMIDGTWQCLDGTIQPVLQLTDGIITMVINGTLQGNMCVDPAAINMQRDAPFYGLYKLTRSIKVPPNDDPDDKTLPNEIYGAAEVFENYQCTKKNAAGNKYVGFAFLAPTPVVDPPFKAGELLNCLFYLIPRWAASVSGDPSQSLYNTLGKPLYGSTSATGELVVVKAAATPTPKQCLPVPALAPAIAAKIAGTHTLAVNALNTSTDPKIDTTKFVQPGHDDMTLSSRPEDQVVVAACTSMYCNSSNTSLGTKKIVIIAWEEALSIPPSCPATGVVKYYLTSLMYQTGTATTLVNGASRANTVQDAVQADSGKTYRYFVDVVNVDDEVNHLITYTLTAYVATSKDDVTTTPFDKSPVPYTSMPQVFNVILTPYTEEYCASIPSPYPDDTVPNMHWLDKDMCFWEPNNQAASDYYCAVARDGYDPRKLQLVTSTGTACGALNSTFPTLNNDEWGTAASCDLTPEELLSSTPPPGCSGIPQSRRAICSPVLSISGGGDIGGAVAFETRMSALNDFYATHGSTDKLVESSIGNYDARKQLYNTYFHCGPLTGSHTWGGMDVAVPCDPRDAACIHASAASQGCSRNKCSDWSADSTDTMTFSQDRLCYPPAWQTDTTNSSVCCSGHGTFSANGSNAACFCAPGAYTGPTCSDLICNTANTCNGHGTCGINEATGRAQCNCDEGYYNVDAKLPGDMWEAPENLLTCNKNMCAEDCTDSYGVQHPVLRGNCNHQNGLCECFQYYGCYIPTSNPSPNNTCTGTCTGTCKNQRSNPNETQHQFCIDAVSATPFDTISLPAIRFTRNRLSSGSDTIVTRHMLLFVTSFQATTDNISLDLSMWVAVGPGSKADHLLASFVVLDDAVYTKSNVPLDGTDIPGLKNTTKDESPRVFNMLQIEGVVVAGTYPKTQTLPNYDVDMVGRDVKGITVHTVQQRKQVTVNQWYDVFVYLGIATDDNVTVGIDPNSTIKMYH